MQTFCQHGEGDGGGGGLEAVALLGGLLEEGDKETKNAQNVPGYFKSVMIMMVVVVVVYLPVRSE